MQRVNAKAAKTIRKRTKSKQVRKWARVMFSIDGDVYGAFKRVCEREHLKHSAVVEEFMKFYVETARIKRGN